MEDEKQIELDALQSIFLDQFKPGENPNSFEIILLPNPDAGPDMNQVGLVLEVTYTDDYPNEVPRLSVRSFKGISSKLCRELQDKILETAKELIGMQMIYNLAQVLKDWLDEQNMDELTKQKEKDKAKEEVEIEKEAAEYRLAQSKDGTAVTKESFKAWFSKFLETHPDKPRMINEATRGKLTGRQIFETMSLSAIAQMAANELSQQKAEDKGAAAPGQAVDWDLFDAEAENLDDLE